MGLSLFAFSGSASVEHRFNIAGDRVELARRLPRLFDGYVIEFGPVVAGPVMALEGARLTGTSEAAVCGFSAVFEVTVDGYVLAQDEDEAAEVAYIHVRAVVAGAATTEYVPLTKMVVNGEVDDEPVDFDAADRDRLVLDPEARTIDFEEAIDMAGNR